MEFVTVWRICHKQFSHTAFSGEVARLFGGRFNSEGLAAVYTAGSLSLALLEMLVRTNDRDYFKECVVFVAEIPEQTIYNPGTGELPIGWDNIPHGNRSQQLGDEWLKTKSHLAMKVPSVVVPVEYNFMLNPAHPDFNRIKVSTVDSIPFDKRLFG